MCELLTFGFGINKLSKIFLITFKSQSSFSTFIKQLINSNKNIYHEGFRKQKIHLKFLSGHFSLKFYSFFSFKFELIGYWNCFIVNRSLLLLWLLLPPSLPRKDSVALDTEDMVCIMAMVCIMEFIMISTLTQPTNILTVLPISSLVMSRVLLKSATGQLLRDITLSSNPMVFFVL